MIRLSRKRVVYMLICIYPLVNLCACIAFKGDNLATISILYCSAILLLLYWVEPRVSRMEVLGNVVLFLTMVITCIRDSGGIANVLEFVLTILLLNRYSKSYFQVEDFKEYLRKRNRVVFLIHAMFLGIVMFNIIQNGISYNAGFRTQILQLYYLYPHTFAYILLFLSIFAYDMFIISGTKLYLLFIIIDAVFLLLTAVRSALFAFVICILFVLWETFHEKKYLKTILLISIGLICVLFAMSQGYFDSLIEKTQLAVSMGSFTNGRGTIAISSLKSLQNCLPFSILFGVGLTNLLSSNLKVMGAAIHAHNDLVDALCIYGVFNLVLYCKAVLSLVDKNKLFFGMFIACLIIGNGLYTYIDAVPMLIFVRIFFGTIVAEREK